MAIYRYFFAFNKDRTRARGLQYKWQVRLQVMHDVSHYWLLNVANIVDLSSTHEFLGRLFLLRGPSNR